MGDRRISALENPRTMMETTITALRRHIPIEFTLSREAINCHHNYVEKERNLSEIMGDRRELDPPPFGSQLRPLRFLVAPPFPILDIFSI